MGQNIDVVLLAPLDDTLQSQFLILHNITVGIILDSKTDVASITQEDQGKLHPLLPSSDTPSKLSRKYPFSDGNTLGTNAISWAHLELG